MPNQILGRDLDSQPRGFQAYEQFFHSKPRKLGKLQSAWSLGQDKAPVVFSL